MKGSLSPPSDHRQDRSWGKLLVEVLGLPWEPEQMEPLAAPVR